MRHRREARWCAAERLPARHRRGTCMAHEECMANAMAQPGRPHHLCQLAVHLPSLSRWVKKEARLPSWLVHAHVHVRAHEHVCTCTCTCTCTYTWYMHVHMHMHGRCSGTTCPAGRTTASCNETTPSTFVTAVISTVQAGDNTSSGVRSGETGIRSGVGRGVRPDAGHVEMRLVGCDAHIDRLQSESSRADISLPS